MYTGEGRGLERSTCEDGALGHTAVLAAGKTAGLRGCQTESANISQATAALITTEFPFPLGTISYSSLHAGWHSIRSSTNVDLSCMDELRST